MSSERPTFREARALVWKRSGGFKFGASVLAMALLFVIIGDVTNAPPLATAVIGVLSIGIYTLVSTFKARSALKEELKQEKDAR
jgi:hypothetical protein